MFCWRHKMHMLGSIQHGHVSLLAGWIAVYLGYPAALFPYFYCNFIGPVPVPQKDHGNPYYIHYLYATNNRNGQGGPPPGPGWVFGRGNSRGRVSHEQASSEEYLMGVSAGEGMWVPRDGG